MQYRLTRIEAPDWATQPDFDVGGVTVAEYSELQRHRDELLTIVHQDIENYLNHVVDRHDLRRDIQLNAEVTGAVFDKQPQP